MPAARRLSAGDAHVRYPETHGGLRKPEDFLVLQDAGMGQQRHAGARFAVQAGEIAPVGYGNAQVVDAAVERIVERHKKLYHRDGATSREIKALTGPLFAFIIAST